MIDGSTCPHCAGHVSTDDGTRYTCDDCGEAFDSADLFLPLGSGVSKSFFLPSSSLDMRRLSSDWESTRLKIELSPVQIREAALL